MSLLKQIVLKIKEIKINFRENSKLVINIQRTNRNILNTFLALILESYLIPSFAANLTKIQNFSFIIKLIKLGQVTVENRIYIDKNTCELFSNFPKQLLIFRIYNEIV